jgi:dienelactone hydrolase
MQHARLAAALGALLLGVATGACTGSPSASPGGSTTAPSGPTPDPSFAAVVLDAATLTAYDPSQPLDLREESPVQDRDGIAVHDVSWTSPLGGRVTAWLVVPSGSGPFAGLVYLHGSETWRDDFLDEALAMAHGGAASLVLDAPFARVGENKRYALQSYRDPERERTMTAQAVVDVRRAYDVLEARPDVDPGRLGFVGHSWGASLGVIVAAVDPRPGSLVLLSGRPSWTGFLRTTSDTRFTRERDRIGDAAWQRYLDLMAPLDAMAEIAHVDAARLYLQYGTQDDVVPPAVATQLIDAAAGAKVGLYPAGHDLDDQATADRVGWLVGRLGLEAISAEVLATVGLPDR